MKTMTDLAQGLRIPASLCLLLFSSWFLPGLVGAQEAGRLTFQDLMQVRRIQQPSLSRNGEWIALSAVPDRGDGEALVYSADGRTRYSVPRGVGPVISADGLWVAMRLEPSFEARETAEGGDAPRAGLALLDTRTGEVSEWDDVEGFGFSGDGSWLARHLYAPEEGEDDEAGQTQEPPEGEAPRTRDHPGTKLILRKLSSGTEREISHVARFAFDERGEWLAFVVASPGGPKSDPWLGGPKEAVWPGFFPRRTKMESRVPETFHSGMAVRSRWLSVPMIFPRPGSSLSPTPSSGAKTGIDCFMVRAP